MNEIVAKEQQFLDNISIDLTNRLASESSAIGQSFNIQRFIMNSLEAVRQAKLKDKPVTPQQVANCLMKGAYLNLDFFQGECYAIFYRDRGLVFQTDYKGEVKLAKMYSVKPIYEIYAEVVREGDEYEKVTIQSQRHINHKPKRFNTANIEGAYAVVRYVDGATDMVEISTDEIEKIRRTYSKAPDSGAWVNRYSEMCKKTALRLLCKNIQLNFTTEQFKAYQEAGDCEFEKKTVAVNPFNTSEQPIEAEVVDTSAEMEQISDEATEEKHIVDVNKTSEPVSVCSVCGAEISEKVYNYSVKKFGKALCYNCQKKAG